MTAAIIWTVLIIAVIATGVGLAVVATRDTGQRASGDRSFWRVNGDAPPSPHVHLAPGVSFDLPCYDSDPRWALELTHELPGRARREDLCGLDPIAGTGADRVMPSGSRAMQPHASEGPAGVNHSDALAPWVAIALANATVGDTVIGPVNDRIPVDPWLEQVTGGDPFDGKGSGDAYIEWLFAGLVGAS